MSGLEEKECFEGMHLSEAAVALLADGEAALVAREAIDHAAGCSACAEKVTEAALASAEVHAAFAALPEQAASRSGAAWAIGSGLLVAGVASAPSLSGLARGVAELRHALEVLLSVSLQTEQALRMASGRLETVRAAATWAASFTLIAVGLWIARRGPRRATTKLEEEAR